MAPGPVYLYNGFKKRGEISIIITRFSFACRRLHKKKKKKKRTGDVNQPAALPAQATHSLFFFFIWLFLLLLERENNHNQQETSQELIYIYKKKDRGPVLSLSVHYTPVIYSRRRERIGYLGGRWGGFLQCALNELNRALTRRQPHTHTQQTRRQQQQVSEPPRLL